MRSLLLLLLCLNANAAALACSCMGNNSYCETLGPQQFLNPDATAMVVKLSDIHYGITVKVVQTFGGSSLPNDTLTVWGDNGGLCRIGVNGIAIGDTVIFGLNETDFSGNIIWNSQYPPDLEEPGHYMVSVCGVYALNFVNGMVVGWITAPVTQTMTIGEFEAVVVGCTTGTGVHGTAPGPELIVRYTGEGPILQLPEVNGKATLTVCDALGATVLKRSWDGNALALSSFAPRLYVVEVGTANGSVRKKVYIP
ncbi:MAG: hypothetical protein IPN38_02955 [Flavobacteriales bacterium]|nr:hypothetical protein [Flavobacteriales bacterium]